MRPSAGLIRLVSQTFLWAMVGQVVVGIAQPLVLNALTKTATGYLPERERPAGIAVGSAGQFVGAILALAMGPLLEGHRNLGPLLPIQAALACAAALGLTVGLRRAPAAAGPSAAIGIAEMRAVWSVPLIRTLTWLAFVGIGVFVALSTWLQPILHHDRISSTAAGAMLAGMLVAGTIGCGVVPPAVARMGHERSYLTLTVVWVCGCCVALSVVHAVTVADFILIAAIGFILLAALPVMLELTERRNGRLGWGCHRHPAARRQRRRADRGDHRRSARRRSDRRLPRARRRGDRRPPGGAPGRRGVGLRCAAWMIDSTTCPGVGTGSYLWTDRGRGTAWRL